MSTIDLKVEFGGGLELLFGNQRTHTLSLPPSTSTTPPPTPTHDSGGTGADLTLTYLMHHLRTHVLTERPELFMEGDTVYVACNSDTHTDTATGADVRR